RDLLEQTIDQLLRATYRQRRDVIDGFLRVQLGALPARLRQRVEQVALDAEQAEFKNLEQPARAGANNDDFRLDGHGENSGGRTKGRACARPALASVGGW